MRNVCEQFADLFAYVRLFEQKSHQGGFQPSYEEVRNTIVTLLEEQDTAAKCNDSLGQAYQDARFAVVAWVDDTILHYTDWQHHRQWKTFPLQLEYYHTRNAADEVLERLGRLGAEQQQVRELYYQCFDLKLIGKHLFDLDQERPHGHHDQPPTHRPPQITKEPQEAFRSTPEAAPAPAPAPPARQPRPYQTRYRRTVLLAVGGLLVLLLGYLYMPLPHMPLPRRLDFTSESAIPVPPAPLPASQEALQNWLDGQPELLQCSRISRLAVHAQTGQVHLEGRIASATQRAAILEGVRGMPGVTAVSDALQLVPPPFCSVLGLLESHQASGQSASVTVRLNKTGAPPVYFNKDNLVIEVGTPGTLAGYVYVDYYTTDQAVWHVFPNPSEPQNLGQPGGVLTIGDPGGASPWRVAPPFGLELVTVVVSKAPLFLQPRYGVEPAASFLPALRQALAEANSEVAATFSFVLTQERP